MKCYECEDFDCCLRCEDENVTCAYEKIRKKRREKDKISQWLNEHGYNFYGEKVEHFAARHNLETLQTIKNCYAAQKNIKDI